jgi:hypothetical protein
MTQVTKAEQIAESLVGIAKEFTGQGDAVHKAAVEASNLTLATLVEAGVVSKEFYEEVIGHLMKMVLLRMLGGLIGDGKVE